MLFDDIGFDPSMGLAAGTFHQGNAGWNGHDALLTLPPTSSPSAAFAHEFHARAFWGDDDIDLTPVTMSASETGTPIVIVKYVTSDPTDGFGDPGGAEEQEFSGIPADGSGGGYSDSDELTVSRDPSLPPLSAEQQAVVDKLIHRFAEWLGSLRGLPLGAFFTLPDGSTVTASQLVDRFSNIDFVLFPTGHDFGNGGNGAAVLNGGNPILMITIGQLANNMTTLDSAAWYLTHELAHLTDAGQAMNNSMTQFGSPGGAQITSSEWTANEQFANSLGRAIAQAAGYTFGPAFLEQGAPYGYGGTVSYSTGQ